MRRVRQKGAGKLEAASDGCQNEAWKLQKIHDL